MKILDVLCGPWSILPDRLREITEIYNVHLKGDKIDLKLIETQIGKPLENKEKTYRVENGVGIIEIEGVIAKRMNLFTRISGGTSTQLVERDFLAAMKDSLASSILFLIDSPGGTVDGTQELANVIYRNRGGKRIVAFSDGVMASAAYWIGAATDKLYISGDTTAVGSIGVVAQHVDFSKWEEKQGVKTTEVIAGKYKRIASQYAPLTEEGKQTIQEIVDHVYSAFVDDVAKFRGVSGEEVLEKMADGRIFMGKKAIKAGLVDGTSTLEKLINKYGTRNSPRTIRAIAEEKIRETKERRNHGQEN